MCVFEKRVQTEKGPTTPTQTQVLPDALTHPRMLRLAPRSMPTTSLAWPVVGWADCGACEPYRCLGNQCSSKRRGGVQQRTPRRIAYFRNATNGATALNNDGCELQSTEDPRLALGRSKPLAIHPRLTSLSIDQSGAAAGTLASLRIDSTAAPPSSKRAACGSKPAAASPLLTAPPPPPQTHTHNKPPIHGIDRRRRPGPAHRGTCDRSAFNPTPC